MKKHLLSFSVLLMGVALLTACDNDDDNVPARQAVDVSNGVFVVCTGNMSAPINGEVSYYDYASGTVTPRAFEMANGRALGLTSNDAVVYGSKMYIVVDNENTIEVVDKNTLTSIRQIKLTELLGSSEDVSPRHIVADGGRIYVSAYGSSTADWSTYTTSGAGLVAAIDTTNYSLAQRYATGCFPEGLAVLGSNIYVVNSNYSMGNASISKINISTGAEEKITDKQIVNPVGIVAIGGNLYYLDSGKYDSAPPYAQVGAAVFKMTPAGEISKAVDATAMGSDGKNIYVINAPYGVGTVSYAVYDVASATAKAFTPSEDVEYPKAIGVDPLNGSVFIASNSKNADTGYADYRAAGYVKQYKADGTFICRFNCAVGPETFVFNTGVKYE